MDIHTIIASSPRILVLLWGVTLPFCAFAAWLFLYLAAQHAPVAAGLLAGFFLVIGVTLLVGMVELTLHYVMYDAVRLTLTGETPAVGKRLDGVVDLPASAPAAWVGVELVCVHVTCERIGPDRTATFQRDCWSARRQFPVHHRGRRSSADVRFDIPDSLPSSGEMPAAGTPAPADTGRDHYVWELRIEASGAEPKFRRTLRVHVA